MKKIISFLLLIFVFSCVTCYATETPTISVVQEESDAEKEISVNIQITENSMACGGKIDLLYDNMLITPESYQVGSLVSNSTCMVNLNYEENVIRISWAGTEELVDAGVLCNIRFSVATNEDMTSEIQVKQAKIADMNGEPISVKTENCTINYTKKESTSTSRPTGGSGGLRPSKNNDIEQNKEILNEGLPFKDVKETDWYYEAVKFAFENNLMKGVSDIEFSPQDNVTRAMFVTVLYRMENEPETAVSHFKDIELESWYAKAVTWASENNIVNGISATEFAPNDNITREQMVAIIFRYAKYRNSDVNIAKNTNILSYDDFNQISDYAIEAFQYVCGIGIIKGVTENSLAPKENATRAQMAAIFMRLLDIV